MVLAIRADPAPIADQRHFSEQGRLRGQRIEPPHIARGIDAAQMKRFWFGLRHGRILASFANAVQWVL